jgi:hypothetical protein
MSMIVKFFKLPKNQQRLILRTVFLAASLRLGLWVLPFSVVRRIAARMSRGRPHRQGLRTDRIIWAVNKASLVVPGSNCLVRALTTHTLMKQSGIPSKLQVGVAKDDRGRLLSHAWVECNNRVVIGHDAAVKYQPILSIT